MPIPSGTSMSKTWVGEYDFAVDGGAVSSIALRSNDGPIPSGSYIITGLLEIDTAFTSGGAATVAVTIESAADAQGAAAVSGAPWSTLGRKSISAVGTGASSIKTSAARIPVFVVATAALTAGKGRLILFYR